MQDLGGGSSTWRPCWGDRGGDREDRLGMLVMDGVPGMVRLGALCDPALTDSGPGALKKPTPPSRHVLIGSEPVSFMPAASQVITKSATCTAHPKNTATWMLLVSFASAAAADM